jgi:hypothetical protein
MDGLIMVRAKNVTTSMTRYFTTDIIEKANERKISVHLENIVTFTTKTRLTFAERNVLDEKSRVSMLEYDDKVEKYRNLSRLEQATTEPPTKPMIVKEHRENKRVVEYTGFVYSVFVNRLESFMFLIHPIWVKHDDIEVIELAKLTCDGHYEDGHDKTMFDDKMVIEKQVKEIDELNNTVEAFQRLTTRMVEYFPDVKKNIDPITNTTYPFVDKKYRTWNKE